MFNAYRVKVSLYKFFQERGLQLKGGNEIQKIKTPPLPPTLRNPRNINSRHSNKLPALTMVSSLLFLRSRISLILPFSAMPNFIAFNSTISRFPFNFQSFTTASTSPPKRIDTHNNTFHSDEALGCFMTGLTLKFHGAQIIRTRNLPVLSLQDMSTLERRYHLASPLIRQHHVRRPQDYFVYCSNRQALCLIKVSFS